MAINQLKGGVALSYVTIFLINAIGLVITPFIIRSLGSAEYGLYTMIGALVGYLTVLDFGLNKTIVRFVAKYQAEKDVKGQENFLAHAFIMYSFIVLGIVVIGATIYFNLDAIYGTSLTIDELAKAKVMFSILIFNIAIVLPGGAFNGINSGYEEFILPRIANIIKYVLRSGLVVAVLLMGGDAIGLVVVDTAMNLLLICANMFIAFKRLKISIKLHQFEKKLLKLIFGYSVWIFVFAIVNQFRWQFGQLILGVTFSTSVVAVYAVGITLGNYYGSFSSAIESVFLPRAIQMVSANASPKELTDMFIRVSRIILFVLLYVLGGFVLIGYEFVYYWAGEEFTDAYLYVILMMLGLILILSQGFGNNILEAKNKLKFRGVLLLSLTIAGAVLGANLAQEYKGLGMIVGTVVFMWLERVIMTWYYQSRIKLNMVHYYKSVLPLFLAAGIIIWLTYYFSQYLQEYSITFMLIKVLGYSTLFISVFWWLMTLSEKELIKSGLRKLKFLSS